MHVLANDTLQCTYLEVRDLEGAALLEQLLTLGAAPRSGPVHVRDLHSRSVQGLRSGAGVCRCTSAGTVASGSSGGSSSTLH